LYVIAYFIKSLLSHVGNLHCVKTIIWSTCASRHYISGCQTFAYVFEIILCMINANLKIGTNERSSFSIYFWCPFYTSTNWLSYCLCQKTVIWGKIMGVKHVLI
jgi:hypothetical protein